MIGTLKIIEKSPKRGEDGKFRPSIPILFDELGPEFVSLGQDEDYYRNLLKFVRRERAGEILSSLSDISWEPARAMQFETCPSFRNSLIRFNTANRARRTGRAIILGEAIHDSVAFQYRADIPGASTSCSIEIKFDADDKIPGRIACLIGRNAVGKTQVLASLAMDLTQIAQRSREELEKREDRFSVSQALCSPPRDCGFLQCPPLDKFRRIEICRHWIRLLRFAERKGNSLRSSISLQNTSALSIG